MFSFGLGGSPLRLVFWNQNLGTPQQEVKGGWLLLVCHFLDDCRHNIKYTIFLLHSEGRKGVRKEGRKKGRTEGRNEEHNESVCACMFHVNLQRKTGSHEMSGRTALVRCNSRIPFAFHSCQRFNERCKTLMLGVTGGGVTQLAAKHQ